MSNGTIILLCDDQQVIHETLREYLEAESFTCISAFDGAAALGMFAETNPNLVLLDLMLPKIDGLEVCREIRKESDTPIIMLTAKVRRSTVSLGSNSAPMTTLSNHSAHAKSWRG